MKIAALLCAAAAGVFIGWTACIIAAFAASKGQLGVGTVVQP